MRLLFLFGLGLLVASCNSGNSFNRSYVITQSHVEPEEELAQPEEAIGLVQP